VPRQQSSGGKTVLLGISKRGDAYLRTLLIHGARSVIYASGRKKESMNRWLAELIQRRNSNLATVALANKMARIAWALLARDRLFQPGYRAALLSA
jgi:transposase